MGKTKKLALTTLLSIITLLMPCISSAAQSNQYIGSGESFSDSGPLRCDLTQNTASDHMPAESDKEDSVPWSSEKPARPLQDAGGNKRDSSHSSYSPHWTVSAEAIVFERLGTADRTLVERAPGSVPFINVPTTPGIQALESTDLDQGFSPGFRVGVTYHTNSNYGLEFSFFRVSGWGATRSIGPDNPPNWLVMRAPGSFFQTQDFSYQSMTWDYSTDLYNAELNVRHNLSNHITLLAGFRWLQLNEDLQGTIPPMDRILPTWKYNPMSTLFDVQRIENEPGGTQSTGAFPPFWDASSVNNLYGLQIGANGKLFELGRFSIDGLIKVGGYWNHASQSTGVSLQKAVYPSGASTDRAAFVGEAGLQCKYRVAKWLTLKFGYEALWLDGVALAPGQIQETYTIAPATVYSLGINSDSDVLFHGATAGLELSF